MKATLYLTRNGLLEPLGQSQVLAYLRGLSQHYRITLITYEKDADWANEKLVMRVRQDCEALGIRWLPLHFRGRPRLLASALTMMEMAWLARREVRAQNIRLIHARSYIPAAVALVVGAMSRIPFIFDMRSLWPEELITAGRLRRNTLLHSAIVAAERACLRSAAAVVSLTEAAAAHLQHTYPDEMAGQRIAVIPTCADLERFRPPSHLSDQRIVGCLGTVLSGWFKTDWLASFLTVAARREPDLRFELTTRDDPGQVLTALGLEETVRARVNIAPCPSDQVQDVLRGQMASVMFYAGGQVSELGRSPTRMAEILGCGVPVVVNEGVGDVARIVRNYRVGVVASGSTPESMEATWTELRTLLNDPDLPLRCRQAAEDVFSLECGIAAYASLYHAILHERPTDPAPRANIPDGNFQVEQPLAR